MAETARIQASGEGEVFLAGPFRIVTQLTGEQTGGAFELYELSLGVATVDYHVHNTMDETIYVLEGQVEFNVRGETSLRPAGSLAYIPRGIHHGFRNLGPAEARVLIHFNPARSQDAYFRELVRLFSVPTLDTDALHAVQRRYDQQLVSTD
jgi:mannose-6-phosphate isomerase-like protein (cupin superfamily)